MLHDVEHYYYKRGLHQVTTIVAGHLFSITCAWRNINKFIRSISVFQKSHRKYRGLFDTHPPNKILANDSSIYLVTGPK